MIKNKVTNYGEEYNRESMYETARESLLQGKKVLINGKYYSSLVGVMIEDYGMELDKEEAFKDNEKNLNNNRRATIDALSKRLDVAVEKEKEITQKLIELHKAVYTNGNLRKCTIDQLKYYLRVLKKYKICLFNSMYTDTIDTLTNAQYEIAKRLIKETEEELERRQVDIKL